MKLFTALAALTLIAAPVPAFAGSSDVAACQKTWNQLKELGMDPAQSMKPCASLDNYKSPAQRIAAAGGKTALIRNCEAIWKPQLKDQRSYSYQSAEVIASDDSFKVTVQYTANNSFGARTPGNFACNFGG